MYIISLILSIILIIVIAKIDKKKSTKLDDNFWQLTGGDVWIEDYEGRVNIYKFLIAFSFIPFVNSFISFVLSLVLIIYVLYIIINKITNKLF